MDSTWRKSASPGALFLGLVVHACGCVLVAGCNYVLHSSGQLFSHKRKHERRLWEYAATCKRPRLIAPAIASSSEAIASSSDVRIAAAGPSSTAVTSLHGVTVLPTHTRTSATACKPADSTPLCATTAALHGGASFGNQPSVSKLITTPNVPQPPPNISYIVQVSDPPAFSSTAAAAKHPDETGESTKQNVVLVSTAAAAAQPETVTKSVNLSATRQSPAVITAVDDDCVFVARSSPVPIKVVEQPFSLALSKELPAHPDDISLQEKLMEKKEYVDLEDLAKMAKLKQMVDEKKAEPESQQSTQHANVVAFGSVSGTPLTQDVTAANSTSAVSAASATLSLEISLTPSNSITTTKPSRSGKERDESWQKYIKRLAIGHFFVGICCCAFRVLLVLIELNRYRFLLTFNYA